MVASAGGPPAGHKARSRMPHSHLCLPHWWRQHRDRTPIAGRSPSALWSSWCPTHSGSRRPAHSNLQRPAHSSLPASWPAGEGLGQGNRTTHANSPARPACAQGCRPPSRQTRRRSGSQFALDEDTRGHPVSRGCRGPAGSRGHICTRPGEGSQPRGHRADVV